MVPADHHRPVSHARVEVDGRVAIAAQNAGHQWRSLIRVAKSSAMAIASTRDLQRKGIDCLDNSATCGIRQPDQRPIRRLGSEPTWLPIGGTRQSALVLRSCARENAPACPPSVTQQPRPGLESGVPGDARLDPAGHRLINLRSAQGSVISVVGDSWRSTVCVGRHRARFRVTACAGVRGAGSRGVSRAVCSVLSPRRRSQSLEAAWTIADGPSTKWHANSTPSADENQTQASGVSSSALARSPGVS